MLKVTFDNNCLISLENLEPAAAHLNKIIIHHNNRKIKICIASVTSAELQKDKTIADSYQLFLNRIETLGLNNVEILQSVSNWSMGYWGSAFRSSSEADYSLIKRIHVVMWPDTPFSHEDYCKLSQRKAYISGVAKKWRSKEMDVLTLFSHIRNSCDIFVSADPDFGSPGSKKKQELELLGAQKIMTPDEAEHWIHQSIQ